MKWWFRSSVLVIGLFLAACSIQPTPTEGTLESAALQSMSITPNGLNVPADSRTGVLIDLLGTFGTTDTFTFTLLTPPAGVSILTPTLNQAIVNRFRRFHTVLRVGPNVVLGDHVITFQVTSGSVVRTATLNLTVTQTSANPTFKLTPSPNALVIPRAGNKTTTVFITRIKGFNQAIDLSLDSSSTPLTGVTATPVNVLGTAFFKSLTVNASATAAPFGERFQTKVKGTSGSITKQANLNLTVQTPSGELDKSFAADGTLNVQADAFTLLSNDRIIAVHNASNALHLKRFRADGTPDTTFGGNGFVAQHTEVQINVDNIFAFPDNSLMVVGGQPGNLPETFTFRFRANGQIDTSYGGGDGVFSFTMPDELSVENSALQPDGKVLISGAKNGGNVTLFRVLADGSGLDTAFGKRTFSKLKIAELNDIVLQPDGKILLTGYRGLTDEDAVVGRLLSSGAEDSSFEGGFQSSGKATGAQFDEFFCLAVDSSGRILAAGSSREGGLDEAHMARFLPNAELDTSFSGDGKLDMPVSFLEQNMTQTRASLMAVQADGKPLVISVDGVGAAFLTRLSSAGTLDTSFASTGSVDLSGNATIEKVILDSQGRILVSGRSSPGLGFFIARFVP